MSIFNKLNTPTLKKLKSNFFSLSILQLFTYIFPLLTIPYLLRIIGVEYYGLISFAAAICGYLIIVTQYGFELTAVKEISLNKNDKSKLIEIFSSVMQIKFSLLIISFLILLILIFSSKKFDFETYIYILTFGLVLGDVLFPKWFFQGIEKMKYITYINVISRTIFTLAIFVFVTEKNDFYLVPILNSLGFIVGGIYSIYFIHKKFDIRFKIQKFENINYYLKDGWHIFISSLSINLYTQGFTIILGLFSSMTIVGYYSAAEKLIKALISLSKPIYDTIYPHIMELMKNSEIKAIQFIKKATYLSSILNIIVAVCIFLFSEFTIKLIYSEVNDTSVTVLQILAILPFIVGLNNLTGLQIIMAYNLKKDFSKIVLLISFFSIIISVPLAYYYNAIGIAWASVLIEFIFLFAVNIYLLNKKVFLFRRI